METQTEKKAPRKQVKNYCKVALKLGSFRCQAETSIFGKK
jgi:hypothetical protein